MGHRRGRIRKGRAAAREGKMFSDKRHDQDYGSLLYKCNCVHGCTNTMTQEWFQQYFGMCKECVFQGQNHIDENYHGRSSYEPGM